MFASGLFWTRRAVCCALALSGCATLAAAEVHPNPGHDAIAPAPRFTNTLGMEFTLIEPGSFTVGKTGNVRLSDSQDTDYDQQPAHQVTLTKGFYILNTLVSQRYFKSTIVMGNPNDCSWNSAAEFCK